MSALLKDEYYPDYTYEDYRQWEGDWELIDGTAYAMAPSPILTHQAIASLLIQSLGSNISHCNECMVVSEMDYKLADDTVLRPDIALVCGQKSGAYIETPPALIAEILSPATATRDEKIKPILYADARVPWYLIIDPDKLHARIYRLEGDHYDLVTDLSEGTFAFEGHVCVASIDFDFVFERFR